MLTQENISEELASGMAHGLSCMAATSGADMGYVIEDDGPYGAKASLTVPVEGTGASVEVSLESSVTVARQGLLYSAKMSSALFRGGRRLPIWNGVPLHLAPVACGTALDAKRLAVDDSERAAQLLEEAAASPNTRGRAASL